MANDAKFNFYLNRQGPRGQKGEKGDQGFSPSITVNTNTADEYTLLIQNEYDSLVTDNIRPTYDDRGGTYVRVDRANNVQYFGSADMATTANYGEVKLAQASDLASTVDVGNSNVITVELLKTWFGGQVADNLVTTTNNVTIQGQKIFATPTRFMDTVRIGNRLMVTQDDTGTITFDSGEDGTLIGTDATFKKDVRANGNVLIDGNLNVSGATSLFGNANIFGALDVKNGLTVQTGGIKVQGGNLDITGYNTYTEKVFLSPGPMKAVKALTGNLHSDTSAILPEEYITVGDERLPLRLVGTKVLKNGKDVATADTVEAMQSDLNIAKQDIIEAQGDIDNLQMNKQDKLTAGSGITIDADNVISATGGVVDIPIASSTTLGGIKVGENLTISEDGTLSATGGGTGDIPIATTTTAGKVKPDGTTITITDDGTISATGGGGSSITYTAEAPLSISADNVISIDTTDLGGTTLKKDAVNVDYALDLTANGTVGGTSKAARAESNESWHDAYMAFSGHNPSDAISTLWGPSQRKTGSWVELYLPDGVVPYSAAWTYGSTDEILPAVELLASNDGSSYTSLGSVTGVSTVTASMTFNTTDSYKYLRFKFRDACVSSAWGKFGLTSLKVQSSGVTTYTELFIGDNIDVTNGVMNVNSLSGEVNTLSGDVTTLSGKVTAVESKTTSLESALANKQDKLTAGEGIQIEQVVNGELPLNWYKKDPNGGTPDPVPIATPIASEIDIQKYIYPCYGNNLDPTTTHSASIKYTMRVKEGIGGMQNRYSGLLTFNFGDYNEILYEYYNNRFAIVPQMKNSSANINLSVSQNYLSVAEGDLITTEIAISGSKKTIDIKVYNKITGTVYATATASNIEWVGGPAGAISPYFYYDGHDAMGLLTDSIVISNMEDAQTQNIISSTTPITYLTRAQYDALETKDANTMYVITDEEGGSGGRNVGEIITSTLPLTDAGLHLLDGTRLSGDGIYGEFVQYIADLYAENPSANYFTTEALWQQSVTTYGVCGKFVYDSTNNTVRLPKITGIIEGTTDISALGDLVKAGLPNITGTINGPSGISSSGAFTVEPATALTGGKSSSVREGNTYFNASLSNSIYGNSNTVQPQTIKTFYYIVIATSTKTDIQVDIDEIATDLNGKADTDLSNVTDTGYIKMAGASMPSNTYENLTLGASGSTYTAPADGWFYFAKKASANGQYVYFGEMSIPYGLSGGDSMILLPCKKGGTKTLTYNLGGTTSFFRFYYAQGSESEAS